MHQTYQKFPATVMLSLQFAQQSKQLKSVIVQAHVMATTVLQFDATFSIVAVIAIHFQSVVGAAIPIPVFKQELV
jgi:hypothetical protein